MFFDARALLIDLKIGSMTGTSNSEVSTMHLSVESGSNYDYVYLYGYRKTQWNVDYTKFNIKAKYFLPIVRYNQDDSIAEVVKVGLINGFPNLANIIIGNGINNSFQIKSTSGNVTISVENLSCKLSWLI